VTLTLDRRRYGTTNLVYLLADGADAALVDPGDAEAALGLAAAHGVRPRWILHTHGHADHTGGTAAVAARLGAEVLGHPGDAAWFAPPRPLAGGEVLALGALRVGVHHVPGHTPGSVLLECGPHLLTGDTLFTGGCGNCRSGGDVAALARSFLGVLARLDGGLLVHPGHDYAAANLPFVLELEPGNAAAAARLAEAEAWARVGREPTPARLDQERAVNPFLRTSGAEAFVALRARRDAWSPARAGP
jgi:hydroxyacylglutathione hydrolase